MFFFAFHCSPSSLSVHLIFFSRFSVSSHHLLLSIRCPGERFEGEGLCRGKSPASVFHLTTHRRRDTHWYKSNVSPHTPHMQIYTRYGYVWRRGRSEGCFDDMECIVGGGLGEPCYAVLLCPVATRWDRVKDWEGPLSLVPCAGGGEYCFESVLS